MPGCLEKDAWRKRAGCRVSGETCWSLLYCGRTFEMAVLVLASAGIVLAWEVALEGHLRTNSQHRA